jgi:hypothetical protein
MNQFPDEIPITPDIAEAILKLRAFIKMRKQAKVIISDEGWTRFEPTPELQDLIRNRQLYPLSEPEPEQPPIQIDETRSRI